MQSIGPEEFIRDLEENTYCRLKQSPIEGIGIFAIRDIPANVNPFPGVHKPEYLTLPLADVVDNPKISAGVKKLVKDIGTVRGDKLYVPNHTLNSIDVSYFLNDSKTPNLRAVEDGESFLTIREVNEGEELTVDYDTYTDK